MKKNILLIATDYINDLAKKLIEKEIADSCFCIYPQFVIDGKTGEFFKDERISYCVMEDVETLENYGKICNINNIPALSKDLLEKMLPYESMAIKLGRRKEQYPSVEYEEEKRFYHVALRFWDYIIKTYNINYVFIDRCPHYRYSYIIYALAKIYNIATLLFTVTSIPDTLVYMDSIDSSGENIGRFYESLEAINDHSEMNPESSVYKYYHKYSGNIDDLISERKGLTFNKSEKKRVSPYYFGAHIGLQGFIFYPKRVISDYYHIVVRGKKIEEFKERRNYYAWLKKTNRRIRYFLKHDAWSVKQYDRIAEKPDYDKPYVFFALQLTPEETTIPRAGVFSEQYTSIQLLARAAQKNGVFIYVKEHYVQSYREKEFYEIIKSIPNVRLISTEVSSFELIKHCLAAATQTGTCILESVLAGKPVLVTSSGQTWKKMPYVYEIINEKQGADIIKQIKEGIAYDKKLVKRYFYAIEQNCIYHFLPGEMEDYKTEQYTRSLNEQFTVLCKFINNELNYSR